MPEITDIMVPIPPITGPSGANHPPLFKDPVVLEGEVIGQEAPVTSGEYHQTLMLRSD